ncbi:MAG TPA: hypothetical protein VFQ61_34685 [Polyangiaceae bacterium]|nr:hypothetical protein [Polyangiaceae bacterium]
MRTQLGSADWSGPTSMAYNLSTLKLYIVQSGRLHRIDDENTGAYSVLGAAVWGDTSAMTSIGSSLYIVSAGNLYKVNPTNGSRTILGSVGAWLGTTSMSAQRWGETKGWLYIVQNDRIHRVDPDNGAWTVIGNAEWGGPTSATCYAPGSTDGASSLFVFQNDRLQKVFRDGSYEAVGGAVWTGPIVSHSISCNL